AVALVGKIEPDELHRALDDLHALAVTADRLTDVERALTAVETRLDSRLSDLLSLADKLQQDLRTLGGLALSVDALNVSARTLAAAVEPLQGAVERLGRLAERVPLARARSCAAPSIPCAPGAQVVHLPV